MFSCSRYMGSWIALMLTSWLLISAGVLWPQKVYQVGACCQKNLYPIFTIKILYTCNLWNVHLRKAGIHGDVNSHLDLPSSEPLLPRASCKRLHSGEPASDHFSNGNPMEPIVFSTSSWSSLPQGNSGVWPPQLPHLSRFPLISGPLAARGLCSRCSGLFGWQPIVHSGVQ